jgi:hypothetical protein
MNPWEGFATAVETIARDSYANLLEISGEPTGVEDSQRVLDAVTQIH